MALTRSARRLQRNRPEEKRLLEQGNPKEPSKKARKKPRRSKPNLAKMEIDTEEKVLTGEVRGWEQYASCKNMTQFGSLESASRRQKSFANSADKNLKNNEEKRNGTEIHSLKPSRATQLPQKPSWLGYASLGMSANPQEKRPCSFGVPSPPRSIFTTPLWVRNDAELVASTLRPQRSLEDLYSDNPDLKLEASINIRTMQLAVEIVQQLLDEAVCRWLNNWCPYMDLWEVSEAIRAATVQGSDHTCKSYNVPPDAIDLSIVTISLAEMYRQCQIFIAKDSDDIRVPQLLELIDRSVIFLRAIKDNKGAARLQNTKPTIQWIPISLDAKKIFVLQDSNTELGKLNRKYKDSIEEGEITSEAQH